MTKNFKILVTTIALSLGLCASSVTAITPDGANLLKMIASRKLACNTANLDDCQIQRFRSLAFQKLPADLVERMLPYGHLPTQKECYILCKLERDGILSIFRNLLDLRDGDLRSNVDARVSSIEYSKLLRIASLNSPGAEDIVGRLSERRYIPTPEQCTALIELNKARVLDLFR